MLQMDLSGKYNNIFVSNIVLFMNISSSVNFDVMDIYESTNNDLIYRDYCA